MLLIVGNNYKLSRSELSRLDILYGHVVIMNIDSYNDNRLIGFIDSNKKIIKKTVLNINKDISQDFISELKELHEVETINCLLSNLNFIEMPNSNYKAILDIRKSLISTYIKNIFDRVFAFIALLCLAPIMLFIAYKIKINSPEGGVFFFQERLGINGRKFKLIKFRTMVPDAEIILKNLLKTDVKIRNEYMKYRKIKNDPRIIPSIGGFIREASLDELPQFINVLKGDMSVVGPRPYIENEFANHEDRFKEVILSLKPGLTGFWQVSDRNLNTFNERVEADLSYIEDQSNWLDFKLILRTVIVVIKRSGI